MNKVYTSDFMKMDNPFEEYLKLVHAEDYHGTDDDMPDAFDDWLGELDGEEYLQHGNEFAKLLIKLIN